jgi:hypothetical protein
MLHHQHTFRCVLSLLLLVPSLVNPLSLLKTLRQERLQQQMQQHQRFQQHFQQRFQQRFHLAESEAGSEAPGFQEPLNLGRYPGQPKMQEDGTEGNHAYYSGNYNPAPDSWGDHNENTAREKSMHGSDYWKQNQYYDYFKKVWGNAPLLDSNFRLWMKGYFKSFKVPNQARSYQQTKALPAFLHYYGKTYVRRGQQRRCLLLCDGASAERSWPCCLFFFFLLSNFFCIVCVFVLTLTGSIVGPTLSK